ncbi:hypothetical protein [Burkholderia metallica]|uniref:hypothetical protein n=1 Tax=Burkholderia metallica TaxID=488729 RepID=UPI001CF304D0|nr:hypothetical protein [Burkholderia metallica]MCA8017774.1 hypothetical protein [Burkholderia metallica]
MNTAVTTREDFSGTQTNALVETASSAVAAQAKAMIEARYIMAIRRPRDIDVVRERLLKECRRPTFAEVARYTKPIGSDKNKWPTGPSIRFAEAAVRHMTNIMVETMIVYDDREKRIVRVTVTDLEANVPYTQDVPIIKTIERRKTKQGDVVLRTRTNSYGDLLYILEATDDDIINKQQALISKAVRTLGLRLVPGDIIDECMNLVVETKKKEDAEDPDAAKRKLFDAFAAIGVRAEQLKEYLGNDATTLTPAELSDLRSIYAAIRDEETTWRDVMENKAEQGTGNEGSNGRSAIRTCSEEEFQQKSPGWRKQVVEGRKTIADLVAMIETRTKLTEEQKMTIDSWGHEND